MTDDDIDDNDAPPPTRALTDEERIAAPVPYLIGERRRKARDRVAEIRFQREMAELDKAGWE